MSVVLYSVGRHRRAGCQFIWNVSKSRVHSNRQGRKEEGGYNLEHLLVSRVCMVWKWDFCIATRFESSPELQLFYKWQLFIDTVERLKLFSITAEPLLSVHPQGKGKWPLKRGRPLNRVGQKLPWVIKLSHCKTMWERITESHEDHNNLVFGRIFQSPLLF